MGNKILINNKYNMTDETISIDLLQTTGLPFHLTPNEEDVRYLAEHWVDAKCERLFVSYRDGVYRVIEGQKRTLAAKMRFVSGKKLKCMVRRDLITLDGESEWFYELNHQKRKFSETKEGFLSRKYFDTEWKKIVTYVEDNGLNVAYDGCSNDGYISRLTTLETIFTDFHVNDTDDNFGEMIKALHNSCIGANESLMANFLKGFAVFHRSYRNVLDENILKKCFIKENKKENKSFIDLDSYRIIQNDTEKFKDDYSKIGKAVAVCIRQIYNKTARNKDKQLKLSPIEDLTTLL